MRIRRLALSLLLMALMLSPAATYAFVSQQKWAGIGYSSSNQHSPPDVQVDVGPSYVMEMVNTQWQVWNKTSGSSVESGNLGTFFGTGSDGLTDPRVLYDYQSQRWFASILDTTTNKILLTASKSSDPRYQSGSNWYTTVTFRAGSYCLDQPMIGTSDDKVALSVNAFSSCTNPTQVGGILLDNQEVRPHGRCQAPFNAEFLEHF